MNWLFSLVLAVHILVAIAIIGLVLMQHGKGADMGAAFGSGASGSLFGATGSANFLSRTTGVLAAVLCKTRYNCRLFRRLLRRAAKRRLCLLMQAPRQRIYRSNAG